MLDNDAARGEALADLLYRTKELQADLRSNAFGDAAAVIGIAIGLVIEEASHATPHAPPHAPSRPNLTPNAIGGPGEGAADSTYDPVAPYAVAETDAENAGEGGVRASAA